MNRGKLYGIGVGPGDPQLMTLKAVNYIQMCSVVAAPRSSKGESLALSIAAGAVNLAGKQIVYLDLPMTRDADVLSSSQKAAADSIAAHLDAGRDVAVLNLGDVSLYSSYSYLSQLLIARGFEAETVPGVTSFSACAALTNKSLTERDLPLHILPASMNDLPGALSLTGGKVLMKSGHELREIKRLLRERNLTERAVLVSDCGLATQKVFLNMEEAPTESYFTTILIAP